MELPPSKYRRSCAACQKRHLKCDLQNPCASCSETGKRCVEASKYQFRNNEDPYRRSGRKKRPKAFPKDQSWTTVPMRLHFVVDSTATDDVANVDEEETVISEEKRIPHRSPSTVVWGAPNTTSSSENVSPLVRSSPDDISVYPWLAALHSGADDPPSTRSNHSLWPVSTTEEGILLRHFSMELSIWFDYLDRDRHFSTVVVQAAATSPALLFAILAVSSKHLSLTQNFDRHTPDRYQLECLKVLIPNLSNPDALLDENLFAATTILRLFDEMTERDPGDATGNYVVGSHMIVNAIQRARSHPPQSAPSSLRSAVLKIELRQDVHIAFVTNRAPSIPVEYYDIDRTLDSADDWTWAWRVIAHVSDTLAYCNGDGMKSLGQWRTLMEYLDTWERMIPLSFRPFFENERNPRDGKLFPELLFANDCHAAGHQYESMARIILLAHDPQIPPLGPDRLSALRERDSRIKEHVLKICGIAISNSHFIPVTFAAGVTISMCGERFKSRDEQQALMQILEGSEEHVTWQILKSSERLKQCWGWI